MQIDLSCVLAEYFLLSPFEAPSLVLSFRLPSQAVERALVRVICVLMLTAQILEVGVPIPSFP